jgi:DNA-directed RNA polymerase I, II, and III subunit RPABC2
LSARQKVQKQPPSKGEGLVKIGPPKLTRFEKARIVGARALQLSMGAPPLVPLDDLKDPIKIAMRELDAGALPISIRRTLPGGMYQDIPLKWLL